MEDVNLWMDFHNARNQTSHTYDETSALEIFETALVFLPQARDLLNRLEARND